MSYLVLSREFIQDDSQPSVGPDGCRTVGRYGFGYAYVKQPPGALITYGPGEFDVAFQQIDFLIAEDGATQAYLSFAANRPVHIAEVPVVPVEWLFRLTNAATFGLGAPLLMPLSDTLGVWAGGAGGFDPVTTIVNVANLLRAGQAAERLCISREQLDKSFLLKHFNQHYDFISGALLTWREIPDWTDESSLPEWVRKGLSS